MLTTARPSETPRVSAITPERILHVSRPAAGGLRQHLATLLTGLGKRGQGCALAGPASLLRALEELPGGPPCGLTVLDITDRPGLLSDIRAALRLRRSAASFNLVHAHGIRAGWIAALSGCRPFVLTAHNLHAPPRNRLLARASSAALRRSSSIIAVSRAVADSLEAAGADGERIRIVPNGIPFPRPRPEFTPRQVRERFGIPEHAPLVLCVARLMADKGVDVLVRAWPGVRAALPSACCLIAGDGPDAPALRQMTPGHTGLTFAGFEDDVVSLYAAADVLAIPSRREGQSLVCLEAMASSPAPAVVASDAGGLPDMVRDGVTGLLVSVDDADALASAIVRLLGDPELRSRLAEAAAGMVAESYSADAMCDATIRVYSETLRAKKPGN